MIKSQCLIAYKLVFNFSENSPLNYLNNQNVEIEANFANEFKLLGINH